MKFPRRLLFVPLILVAFSYLFYSVYKNIKDKTLAEFKTHQFILAKQASIGIESFFIYYQRELSFLSDLSPIAEYDDTGRNLLENFYIKHSDQIEAITIVDTSGILRFTFPYNKDAIGKDISNQEHVRAIIKSHKPTISQVFTAVQGFKAVALHIPVIKDGRFRGSIAILISLDKLSKRFIENIRTGANGYGCLISEDGTELYNPHTNQTGKSVDEIYKMFPSVLEMLKRTSSETEGTSECYISSTSDVKGKSLKNLTAFYRVPLINTYWTIIIFSPENEIFSTLSSFKNRLYFIFSLIIVITIVYFYFTFKASVILEEERKRKAVEKVLRESEKRFRTMFELSPAGIILVDEKGNIIETNESFCNTLGYGKDELKGKNINVFTDNRKEDLIKRNIAAILSGKILKHEVRNFRKDGSVCDIALCESMILLPDGKPGILSVSSDVTAKKNSEQKMRTLSRAIESISECVTITDNENKIIFVNNAFCKTYGYSQEEIIGKDVHILRPSDEIDSERLLNDTIHGGWVGEMMNIRKDGSEFPIELSTSPIKDERGNLIALIGIAVDITERKKERQELIISREKAVESDKLKSAFLANMSHELRTPLNAIIGFSDLQIQESRDPETVTNSRIILESGMHLLSLVEDILDFSLIETGQVKLKYEKTGINPIMNEVKDIISGDRLKENKNGIDILLKINNEAPENHIYTDKRKLKQVLLNLLKNSLKFTEKGLIEFGYEEVKEGNAEYIKFYVSDTGIGIDKEYHKSIFEIFRQIDDSHTRNFGGTGIGLSIVKKNVDLLGGKIWLESEKGKGSVFYFTIPAFREKLEVMDMHLKKINTPFTIS